MNYLACSWENGYYNYINKQYKKNEENELNYLAADSHTRRGAEKENERVCVRVCVRNRERKRERMNATNVSTRETTAKIRFFVVLYKIKHAREKTERSKQKKTNITYRTNKNERFAN